MESRFHAPTENHKIKFQLKKTRKATKYEKVHGIEVPWQYPVQSQNTLEITYASCEI